MWAILALISGHRAIWQVQRLDLDVGDGPLRTGSLIAVKTRSSGRVQVDVILELLQGPRAETLAVQRIPGSQPTFDPRWKRANLSFAVTPKSLTGFFEGPAVVRATAHGRMQWLRTPPPEVRERAVRLSMPYVRITYTNTYCL